MVQPHFFKNAQYIWVHPTKILLRWKQDHSLIPSCPTESIYVQGKVFTYGLDSTEWVRYSLKRVSIPSTKKSSDGFCTEVTLGQTYQLLPFSSLWMKQVTLKFCWPEDPFLTFWLLDLCMCYIWASAYVISSTWYILPSLWNYYPSFKAQFKYHVPPWNLLESSQL